MTCVKPEMCPFQSANWAARRMVEHRSCVIIPLRLDSMDVTDEIKNRLDIVDVIGADVQLRKSGRSYSGFCPFHDNTRTPAFVVFPESQTWRCFGACAEGGDLFSYVMKKNSWDFKEALVELAKRAGVELEQRRPRDKQAVAAEERLAALLDSAAEYFHQLLLHAPQAEAARRYVAERSLNEETIATFRLGFALESWDAARSHFTDQGYSDDDLLRAGLLTENEDKGTRYDRFRNRLMIPIRDLDGRVVGFGARTLDPDGIPKYLNSPQTPLFDKSNLLYGLDMARRPIRDSREAVLVEGYMDVMQAWQAGYRNIVAQMGTALTETQLRTLQRFAKRFILALDADAAGAKATLRSLQVARQTLDRDYDVSFDARGLVMMEGRLKADILVVTLPEGYDPDKIIRTDPDWWPRLLAEARPVVEYVIQTAAAELDPTDAKAKSEMARQVLPLIADISEPIERDHYRSLLAKTLDVDEKALRQVEDQLKKQQRTKTGRRANAQRRSQPPAPSMPPPPPPEWDDDQPAGPPPRVRAGVARRRRPAPLEQDYLRQALAYPGVITSANAVLRRQGEAEVSRRDFTRTDDQAVFDAMEARAAVLPVVTIEEMCDSLEPVLADRVRELMTLPPTPETRLDRLPDMLALSVLDWRLEKLKEQNVTLQQIQSSEGWGAMDEEVAQLFGEQIREIRMAMQRIHSARSAMSALGRRRQEDILAGRRFR